MFTELGRAIDRQSRTSRLIFSSLSTLSRASAKELHSHLYSAYGLKLTYQGVHKILSSLCATGAVVEIDKKFELSREWLLNARSLIDRALDSYSSPRFNRSKLLEELRFTEKFSVDEIWTLNTQSLYETDCIWGDVLLELCLNPSFGGPFPTLYSINGICWWMPLNIGREAKVFNQLKESGMEINFIIMRGKALNSWAAKVYREMGIQVSLSSYLQPYEYFNILGDLIVHVELSQTAIQKVTPTLDCVKPMQDLSLHSILDLAHSNSQARIRVFRSRTLAKALLAKVIGQ